MVGFNLSWVRGFRSVLGGALATANDLGDRADRQDGDDEGGQGGQVLAHRMLLN